MEITLLFVGLAVGAVGAWFVAKYRHESQKGRVEERAEMLAANLQEKSEGLRAEQDNVTNLRAELSGMRERLQFQKSQLEELEKKFTEQFQNIATKIVNDSSQLIQQQHRQKLEDVLGPLKERIQEFERKVDSTREQSIKDSQSLKEQILHLQKLNQTIGDEAKNLTSALKGQAKTMGSWGEMILETLLEKSGLVKGREYTIQEIVVTGSGKRYQPDVIVHLPENKKVIIDSKVSLIAYERYCAALDNAQRNVEIREHISSFRKHIKELSVKSYQNVDELLSLDFVLMFIPIEPAFSLAVNEEPGLYNEAFERNIVLVTPSTLLATLRTVANMWKQEKQSRNALEIARESGALYDKLVNMMEDFKDVGNRMRQAQSSYEEAMKKLFTGSGNLIGRAEHIRELGAKTTKTMPQQLVDRIEEGEQIPLIK